jgi:hypothetical protein
MPPITKDLQDAAELTAGWNAPVKLASPTMASVEDVGTPALQLEAVDQALLVIPFHDV